MSTRHAFGLLCAFTVTSCADSCGSASVVLDAGSSDVGSAVPDVGGDLGAGDTGIDLGAGDSGVDLGAADSGVDLGVADSGVDLGVDAGLPPPPPRIRFAVLGDAGEGNTSQFEVGARMGAVCAQRGCDFVLYLGDNFYDSGVSSVTDPQWQSKFEEPYAPVDAPFYPVLGNHDYGADGLGTDWVRGPVQVQYGLTNPKWRMPSEYHRFVQGHVSFYALDTNAIFWRRTYDQQAAFLRTQLAADTSPWRIGFGHHPYISAGDHGNAGNYEGLWFVPIANGAAVRDFFEEEVCGAFDVYFAGHDHSRQWLTVDCGVLHIVSGAGAKTTSIDNRDDNPYEYADASEPGFLYVDIVGDVMQGTFYDRAGQEDSVHTFVRLSTGTR